MSSTIGLLAESALDVWHEWKEHMRAQGVMGDAEGFHRWVRDERLTSGFKNSPLTVPLLPSWSAALVFKLESDAAQREKVKGWFDRDDVKYLSPEESGYVPLPGGPS